MTIPEPVRAWARPVLAILAVTALLALVLLIGVVAVLNLGTVIGLGLTLFSAAVGVGTGVWWIDRKGLL